MKRFFNEFKEFISKGNVMDLAVGVMVGAAFKSIVDSLVQDILSPMIGLFVDTHIEYLAWELGGVKIGYGAFLTAIFNFFLMAIVLFLIIKAINTAREKGKNLFGSNGELAANEPTTKVCPHCISEVPIAATRCAFCTSELDK